ncbi:ATP-binding cassette domain-containing protein [Ralstonia mojiangensis]|uniref:ATP-binding cassette domain-containing protein n=1 Tax=Ralstonia mojiangensis TaxID=2953895 RepID=UPI002091C1CA|nr:ABC transporter ATP-binding protein [Ralstonia mojiangensis]MCO5412255.1 ABC transporter ATP-binding protein/permease [Ralstonia mojiangensis]
MSHYVARLLARYKYYFAGVIALACLSALLNTSFGALLKWLTDGLQHGKTDILFLFIVLFALQRFLLPIAGASGTLISNRLANRIESDIRKSWYEYVVSLDYGSARLKNSGEYQKKIQEAVFSVRTLLNSTLRSLLSIALEIVSIALFAVIFVGWEAGLVLLLFAALYSAFVVYVTKKRAPMMREIAQSDTECAAFMHDSFINSGAISPDMRNGRLSHHAILLAKLEERKNNNVRKLFLDSIVSSVICVAACFLMLTAYCGQGAGSTGAIILLATGLAQLIIQINALGFNYRNILSAGIDIRRISEGLKIKDGINVGTASPVFGAKRYDFSFQGFCAAGITANGTQPIYGEINISPGVVNTLRGASGIGKSTIARAMRGEIRAPAKQLLINGIDVSGMDSDLLLAKIGYVSQDNTIFNESIIQNLRYGKHDASPKELVDSLSKVGLQKFSDNLEYVVGEKGGRLSGGERQRLVIARGLLQECDILILDEPFSGLDEERAYSLAGTIASLASDTCIFIITHQHPHVLFNRESLGNQHVMEESGGNIYIENRS